MVRKIITIDEEKCIGCKLCVKACNQGAIGIVDGKAKLLRDDYCDGLGECLPVCPTGAITFEERKALPFNKENNKDNKVKKDSSCNSCPGSMSHSIKRNNQEKTEEIKASSNVTNIENMNINIPSMLNQWPVQIKLAPVNAPYFENANLLIAADCTAFSYGNFHKDFMENKVTLIGCPKLDSGDYSETLTEIIKNNNIKSITVARMSVPCCAGIVNAVKIALKNSGEIIPWQIKTISTDGEIIDN